MTGHRLVLVGGGHAHVQVIRALAQQPEPGMTITLVTDRLLTPYSGMLPGHVAGIYSHAEMHIDLGRLAEVCGVTLVGSAAAAIDRARRTVTTEDGASVPYDTLSLNVGITPDLSGIAGAEEHGIPVKPISSFIARLDALLEAAARADGPRRIVLVGGGAAGVELALALKARLTELDPKGRPFWIGLAASNGLVATLNDGVRRRARAALARHGVTLLTTSVSSRSMRKACARRTSASSRPMRCSYPPPRALPPGSPRPGFLPTAMDSFRRRGA